MISLHSWLPTPDRSQEGKLWVEQDGVRVFGPVRCRGETDRPTSAERGNPTQNPTLPYGDHPSGEYVVSAVVEKENLDKYGPFFLILHPVGGQALVAKRNGRLGLGIHGGRTHPDGSLRQTLGCLRVLDADVVEAARWVQTALGAGEAVPYTCQVGGPRPVP